MIVQPSSIVRAPSLVGLRPKSHYSAFAEEHAIRQACEAARFVDLPLPVLFNNQQIGWTLGKQLTPEVLYLPQRRSLDKIVAAGFPNYNTLITAITTNGQRYQAVWQKSATTNGIANNWYDMWPVGGSPVAGTYAGAASSSIQLTDTSTGSLWTFGNVSTETKHILAAWGMFTAGTVAPTIMVYDRCVHYGQVPFNAAALNTFTQTNTPTSVARS
jgi:hypothetical protein